MKVILNSDLNAKETNKKFLRMLHGVQGAPWYGGPIKDGFVTEDVLDNSTCTCNPHLSPLAEKRPPLAAGSN
jgi:hypothetical protein